MLWAIQPVYFHESCFGPHLPIPVHAMHAAQLVEEVTLHQHGGAQLPAVRYVINFVHLDLTTHADDF